MFKLTIEGPGLSVQIDTDHFTAIKIIRSALEARLPVTKSGSNVGAAADNATIPLVGKTEQPDGEPP